MGPRAEQASRQYRSASRSGEGGSRIAGRSGPRSAVASFAVVLADLIRVGHALDLREGLELMILFANRDGCERRATQSSEPAGRPIQEKFRAFALSELEWVDGLEAALARLREQPVSSVEAQLQALPLDQTERRLLVAALSTGSLDEASALCFCSRLALARRLLPPLRAVSSSPVDPHEPPLVARLRDVVRALRMSADSEVS